MIEKKKCQSKKCGKKFYGTAKAKYCCSNCRLKAWRDRQKGK